MSEVKQQRRMSRARDDQIPRQPQMPAQARLLLFRRNDVSRDSNTRPVSSVRKSETKT
jgi:hypothetical protein